MSGSSVSVASPSPGSVDRLARLVTEVERNNRWRHVVHIRNLPQGCTEEDIVAAFKGCGSVASVSLYGMGEDEVKEYRKEEERLQNKEERVRRKDRRKKAGGKDMPNRADHIAFGSHAFVEFAEAEGKASALQPNIRVLGIQVAGGKLDKKQRSANMVNPRDADSLTTLCISLSFMGNGISGRDMADKLNGEPLALHPISIDGWRWMEMDRSLALSPSC